MTSTATGPVRSRALRAAAFAVVSVLVAGVGHAAGHGSVPDGAHLAGAALAALALGALASRARWSVPRLLAALVSVQVVVHGAAWIAAGPGGAVDPRLAAVARSSDLHTAAHAAPLTLRMLLAHAAAVLVAAALLAAIEHAFVTVVAAARRMSPAARVVIPALPPLGAPVAPSPRVFPAPHLAVVRGNAPPVVACT